MITGIIKSTKTKFHLETEFNNRQQTLVVTSRLLAKAFGFKLEGEKHVKMAYICRLCSCSFGLIRQLVGGMIG